MNANFSRRMHPILAILTSAMAVAFAGCDSSDTGAIDAIRAINDAAEANGEQKAALVITDGDKVATLYIQGHVDEIMPHVATLRSVKEISCSNGGFTDAHVAYLKKVKSLNSLVLGNSELTDAGVESLAASLAGTKIENLCLDAAPITSAALQSISEIESLMTLDLTATNVADDLTPLVKLKNLQWLLIRDMDLSQLSEQSLATLAELPELRRLTVTNSGITSQAIQTLKRAKPGLNLEAEHAEDPVEQLTDPDA